MSLDNASPKLERMIIFTDDYLPRDSDLARAVNKMRLELKSVGIDVYVVCPNYGPMEPNQSIVRVPLKHDTFGEIGDADISDHNRKIVEMVCASVRPQLVHIMTPGPIGRLGEQIHRFGRIPLVFSSELDYDAIIEQRYATRKIVRRIANVVFWWWFRTIFIRKSKFILCSDPEMIAHLESKKVKPIVQWSIGSGDYAYPGPKGQISEPLRELLKIYTICLLH